MFGVKIIESLLMVEDGEPYEVRRTWRERLFSLPWRPMRATRTVVPKVPKREAVRMPDGSLVMHPAMAAELRRYKAAGGHSFGGPRNGL